MPDVDTPDPQNSPTPEQIEAWPSGRSVEEQPSMASNPSTGGGLDDPEDGAVEPPAVGAGA